MKQYCIIRKVIRRRRSLIYSPMNHRYWWLHHCINWLHPKSLSSNFPLHLNKRFCLDFGGGILEIFKCHLYKLKIGIVKYNLSWCSECCKRKQINNLSFVRKKFGFLEKIAMLSFILWKRKSSFQWYLNKVGRPSQMLHKRWLLLYMVLVAMVTRLP